MPKRGFKYEKKWEDTLQVMQHKLSRKQFLSWLRSTKEFNLKNNDQGYSDHTLNSNLAGNNPNSKDEKTETNKKKRNPIRLYMHRARRNIKNIISLILYMFGKRFLFQSIIIVKYTKSLHFFTMTKEEEKERFLIHF